MDSQDRRRRHDSNHQIHSDLTRHPNPSPTCNPTGFPRLPSKRGPRYHPNPGSLAPHRLRLQPPFFLSHSSPSYTQKDLPPPQNPLSDSASDPKQLALVKPEQGDKIVDESGNPLSVVRAMVAECLIQGVPFKAIDSSTIVWKLENNENVTAAEKSAMRELGGDSGAILAVEMALRSIAEDNGGLEVEEFVVGSKSRVTVLSIDRTRLVRQLPEEPQNQQKRERVNIVNESESLKTKNSYNEWMALRPTSEIWMGGGDPGMMYTLGGPAGSWGPGRGMMGRPPMGPNAGLLPAQRQRTEEDDLRDLEALLNKKSFMEMQKSKTGEEILNIINGPTAKENAVAAKVYWSLI